MTSDSSPIQEMASLELESNMADGKWHTMSLSVTEKVLSIWVDCDIIYNEPVKKDTEFSFPPKAYISMSLLPKLFNIRVSYIIHAVSNSILSKVCTQINLDPSIQFPSPW